jgi:uncharacterized membrane protein YdfJ with MMPL/SSD domain
MIGTTVIGGMVAETFIGRFFVPAIFYIVEKSNLGALFERLRPRHTAPTTAAGD